MASVEIRQVHKYFGATHVVKGVDVSVADGEFCVLVGPSGCGKSTLLRMIAGLEDVDRGDIAIGGRVVNEIAPKERDIAMVFQNYALYPHMKVRENMAFSLMLARAPREEIEARVEGASRVLGLTDFLHRFPRQLSGGQRQRVAMGRAIVRKPKVFLFDEPLSNLDAKLRVAMRTEIRALHQRLQTTSIYVTHDQIEALTMADRIVVMHDGLVEQSGPPLELYDRPVNTFVAGFIGSPSMNLLPATVAPGGEAITVAGADLPVEIVGLEPGRPLTAGIRPEHVQLAASGIQATTLVVEPVGADTQISFETRVGNLIALLRDRPRLKPGDKVCLAPAPASVHLFDAGTGRRLDTSAVGVPA